MGKALKILITGGAGFIGSHVAIRLNEMGHDVSILDSLSSQVHGDRPEITSPGYQSVRQFSRFLRGSVCDETSWSNILGGQEAIIHLAAETGTGQSMYEIRRYADVNIGGTALMLDVLANRKHCVKKIVVASSRAIHGEGRYRSKSLGVVYPGPRKEEDLKAGRFEPTCEETGEALELMSTDEKSATHPGSVYGITKQTQEQMVLSVARSLGIGAVALRYQNVYGPGQALGNPYTGILSIFSTRILNGNPINVFEDGLESRDFVYVDDVVDSTLAALFREEASGEAIGIGSGVPTSVATVAQSLVALYQSSVPIKVTGDYRLGDIRHNFADIAKARALLDFEPRVSFPDGIARFANWVKGQKIHEDSYERSLLELKERGMFRS